MKLLALQGIGVPPDMQKFIQTSVMWTTWSPFPLPSALMSEIENAYMSECCMRETLKGGLSPMELVVGRIYQNKQ